MTAYYTPNDSFTANDTLLYKNIVDTYTTCRSLQLIVYPHIKITKRYYMYHNSSRVCCQAAEKEHELWLKTFLPKLSTSRDGPVKSSVVNTFIYYVMIMFQEYDSYLLSRDWAGSKCRPVLTCKVWEQLQEKHSKVIQNSYR